MSPWKHNLEIKSIQKATLPDDLRKTDRDDNCLNSEQYPTTSFRARVVEDAGYATSEVGGWCCGWLIGWSVGWLR
jgi:hypothetical protein